MGVLLRRKVGNIEKDELEPVTDVFLSFFLSSLTRRLLLNIR